MKKINTEINLDFDVFVKNMEKGYTGSGTDNEFTFSSFGNKTLKSKLVVSQELMLAYDNYRSSKQILINQLEREK